jgi:hypothetical protein
MKLAGFHPYQQKGAHNRIFSHDWFGLVCQALKSIMLDELVELVCSLSAFA